MDRTTPTESLSTLVERVPEGWTRVTYDGRPYGLSRTTRIGGRVITITAEELGGTDLVSANVYRTTAADHLRACEMPDEKVIAFLRGWK
ncbi:peptide methionine sulfoxide reductase [Microbacterium sp. EST19A]|uniref:peptide methionine sulfoxide reductase n=1 Tax=Microbacterium sp. EST19A TaxID=2862681 RepID=UPI001CBEE92A|nr:peptide methionine sulfoxide reductase [Microbacterium sp. EST19A]